MKFTVAIPAYKASYLKECIDSILAQTESDFELIIVNDASPEDLDSIVRLYTDPRIRYYTNAVNFGAENVVDNWNKCLSYAKGEFFILMGDDDKMEPNYMEEFIKLIDKFPKLDVFHCRSYIINEKSEEIELTPSWPEFESVYENIWHRIKSLRQQFISDFVFRTKVLKQLNGFYKLPLAWSSDDISVYRVIGKKGIAHTNIPVFNYRRNSLTISSSGSAYLKMCALYKESEWFTLFMKDFPSTQIDKTYYKSLQVQIPKYIQKKKIRIITNSFNGHFFKELIFWFKKKEQFEIRIPEIVYASIEFVKQKHVSRSRK